MTRRRRTQFLGVPIRPQDAYADARHSQYVSEKMTTDAQVGFKSLIKKEDLCQALDEVMQYDHFASGIPHGNLLKHIGMKVNKVSV